MIFTSLGSLIEKHGGIIQTGPFGSQLHQHEYVENGIPVIMPKDIHDGHVDETTVARISEQKAQELSRHVLKAGSIVFPRRGEINKCAYISEAQAGFLCGTGCLKIEVPSEVLSPRFLFYYLGLRHVVEWLEKNAVGTTMLNLNTSIVGGISVPIIDKKQQEKIADILSAYDDLIENNRRRIDLLEQSARMLYKEWFVSLGFPGHEHVEVIDGVPVGWEKKTAFDVMEIMSGGTPKTQVPGYWDGNIPFYTPKDYSDAPYVLKTERSITEAGLANCNSHLYPKKTIFISARGTVGKIIMAQKPMAMSQTSYALICKNGLSPFFLYSALQANLQQFLMRATGAVFSAIVVDTFKNIPFILPSQLLIDNFEEYVTPIYAQIENLLLTNERLQQARDLLLPRLMNGEISV